MNPSKKRNRLTRQARCVAVWVGDFSEVVELDDYLYFEFPHDYEVDPDEDNQPEIAVKADGQPIRLLLSQFSDAKMFIDLADRTAVEKRISNAKSAVVYYFSHFDEDGFAGAASLPLRFLGNLTWNPAT